MVEAVRHSTEDYAHAGLRICYRLVRAGMGHETITYRGFADAIGHPNFRNLRPVLDRMAEIDRERGLAPSCAIVVREDTGRPALGAWNDDEFYQVRIALARTWMAYTEF